ncbi:MAG: methyltransferase [Anaerolineae bacterium]
MKKKAAGTTEDQTIETGIGDLSVKLVTRPGFAGWNEVSQAEALLAAHAQLQSGDRVAICPAGHGALGVWAASRTPAGRVSLFDTNSIALEAARKTVAANGRHGVIVQIGTPQADAQPFDVALMVLPKGRDLGRLFFLALFGALREGGTLLLAGPNKGGIKSAIEDAEELFGASTLLAYKGGNRIVALTRPAAPTELPASYREPGLANGTFRLVEAEVRGNTYTVCTRPGVFSWRALDDGTRALLETLDVAATETVLDVGCGYGIIGLDAARRAPRGQATLVDVDALAVECARATLATNVVSNAEVLLGDGLAAVRDRRFSLIVSNPPFHAGYAVSYNAVESFVRGAYDALEPRGRLVLVANRFLPYDRLMREIFGAVGTVASTSKYHVLAAEKAYQRKQRGKQRGTQAGGEGAETVYQIPDTW